MGWVKCARVSSRPRVPLSASPPLNACLPRSFPYVAAKHSPVCAHPHYGTLGFLLVSMEHPLIGLTLLHIFCTQEEYGRICEGEGVGCYIGIVMGYVSAAVYVLARVPQVVKNVCFSLKQQKLCAWPAVFPCIPEHASRRIDTGVLVGGASGTHLTFSLSNLTATFYPTLFRMCGVRRATKIESRSAVHQKVMQGMWESQTRVPCFGLCCGEKSRRLNGQYVNSNCVRTTFESSSSDCLTALPLGRWSA